MNSAPSQSAKEVFRKLVNSLELLAIFVKTFVLDDWEYVTGLEKKKSFCNIS